jgi:hypothetical protein
VRVPAEAGAGKAKLTFSFDAWSGMRVARGQVELPILDAETPTASVSTTPK